MATVKDTRIAMAEVFAALEENLTHLRTMKNMNEEDIRPSIDTTNEDHEPLLLDLPAAATAGITIEVANIVSIEKIPITVTKTKIWKVATMLVEVIQR